MFEDKAAKQNVLRKLIGLMGSQMANRQPLASKGLHVSINHGIEPAHVNAEPDECPHCDGAGCRMCK